MLAGRPLSRIGAISPLGRVAALPGRPRRAWRTGRPRRCSTRRAATRSARRRCRRLGQRLGLEPGVLPGYVAGHPAEQRAQRAGERHRGDRGGVAAGRVGHRLGRAGHGHLDPGVTAETGVVVGAVAGGDQPTVHRVEAGDPGEGEGVARCRTVAGDIVVEPLRGEELDPVGVGLWSRAAVVAAGEPGDPNRGPVRGDPPGVGVGLGQWEEGVRRALHQQGGRRDAVQHPGRAGAPGAVPGPWPGAGLGGRRPARPPASRRRCRRSRPGRSRRFRRRRRRCRPSLT